MFNHIYNITNSALINKNRILILPDFIDKFKPDNEKENWKTYNRF